MNRLKTSLLSLIFTTTSLYSSEVITFGCGITKNAFLTKLNAGFSKKTSQTIKVVGRGGAPRSIKLMGEQKVAVSSGCRPPLDIKGERDVKAHHVAWGAIVAIVNRKNPVNNITSKQFKDILTGKLTNWKSLGGWNMPINLYVRNGKTSGVGYSARMVLFENENIEFSTKAKNKGSSAPIRRAVSKAKDSFAIDDFVTASKNKKLKILSIDGVKPSKETIQNRTYKYARPLFIYSYKEPTDINAQYLKYALSNEGQKIISNNGVVNLNEGKNLKRKY